MKINKLNNKELAIWVSLARTVGPTKFFNLLRASGSLNNAFEYFSRLDNKKVYGIQDAQKEIDHTEKIGAKIIPACDPNYPDFLRNI